MLQTASPDAIVRLERTDLIDEKKAIENMYFQQQQHNSIDEFLKVHVHDDHGEAGLLMQVSCNACLTKTR